MKTLKISADNEISITDVNFDDFKSIQKALGGHFETVHTAKMSNYFQKPVIMLNIINLRLDITHLYYPAKNSFQKGRLKRREIFTELLLYTLTT